MILDVGCGNHKKGHVGLDILTNSDADVLGDAQRMPFRTGIFDKTICTEVLEHIPTPLNAVKEMIRTTRGSLLITVPNILNFWGIKRWIREGRLAGSHEHINGWTTREFRNMLEAAGISKISFSFTTFPHYHKVSRFQNILPRLFSKSVVVNVRL